MAEADVIYTDVNFRAPHTEDQAALPAECIYSKLVNLQKGSDIKQDKLIKRSNSTLKRLVVLVPVLLCAVTVIALGIIVIILNTNKTPQTEQEENEALRKNSSDERLLKCEAGWELHGGNCYYFSTNKFSWEESRHLCKDLGGDLVKIDSREEQMFIKEKLVHMMKNDEDKFWIGLTDLEEEGRWLWADGSPLNTSLSFWRDGQPDNWSKSSLKQADCVRMGQIGGSDVLKSWFDMSCDAHQKRICEKTEKTQ